MKKCIIITLLAFLGLNNILNSQGLNFVWAKSMGGDTDDEGNSITIDASGNIYSTGYFMGGIYGNDFDPGPGDFNLTSAGGKDILFLS
ncbi:MAG: SBBP repeat-containing protein [Lewinellaceae bacterium]|nr:SBBP repeat-containing protein [Lewinellaceae bacterium]